MTQTLDPHTCTADLCPWSSAANPRFVWVAPKEVLEHYGWAKTKGYERMKKLSFPKRLEGQHRLDTLLHWESVELGLIPPDTDPEPATIPESRRGKRNYRGFLCVARFPELTVAGPGQVITRSAPSCLRRRPLVG